MDIVFIMDFSASMGMTNFYKQKSFVTFVAQRLNISPRHSQAAIVVTSTSASVKARFYQHNTTRDFLDVVRKLTYMGGKTRIDKGLDLAVKDIFPRSRPNANKIAIVMTDGHQSSASDSKTLKEASEPLRKIGVHVIAVGIGREVDEVELRSLVRSERDVMLAKDFKDFNDLEFKVMDHLETACSSKSYLSYSSQTISRTQSTQVPLYKEQANFEQSSSSTSLTKMKV